MFVVLQAQYTYVYQCLLDALITGETAIAKSAIRNFHATETNEISRQFEVRVEENCIFKKQLCRILLTVVKILSCWV